jgi:hypothetical protein
MSEQYTVYRETRDSIFSYKRPEAFILRLPLERGSLEKGRSLEKIRYMYSMLYKRIAEHRAAQSARIGPT